jgi:hypothetical protein
MARLKVRSKQELAIELEGGQRLHDPRYVAVES